MVFEGLPAGPEGSPEAAVVEFFAAWSARDWDRVLEVTQRSWIVAHDDPVSSLRALLSAKPLEVKVLSYGALNPVSYVVSANLKRTIARGVSDTKSVRIVVVCEADPGIPVETGDWGVNPVTVL